MLRIFISLPSKIYAASVRRIPRQGGWLWGKKHLASADEPRRVHPVVHQCDASLFEEENEHKV